MKNNILHEERAKLELFFNSDFINYTLIIMLVMAAISIWIAFSNREEIIKAKTFDEQYEILQNQKIVVSGSFISILICILILLLKFLFNH